MPYDLVLHGAEVTVPGRLPGAKQALAYTLTRARRIIAAGGYPAAEAVHAAGRELPVTVIPCGVDPDRFRPLSDDERRDTRARFGIPEVKRGLVAAAGGLLRLQHRIPRNIAMEFALTGDFVEAPRAAQLGLVNRITPSGQALEGARELAARIAENAPMAVAVSKRVIVESDDWPGEERWQRQDDIVSQVFTSHDAAEGAAAFAEKRKPVWKGE